jgi:hypothetical protein
MSAGSSLLVGPPYLPALFVPVSRFFVSRLLVSCPAISRPPVGKLAAHQAMLGVAFFLGADGRGNRCGGAESWSGRGQGRGQDAICIVELGDVEGCTQAAMRDV